MKWSALIVVILFFSILRDTFGVGDVGIFERADAVPLVDVKCANNERTNQPRRQAAGRRRVRSINNNNRQSCDHNWQLVRSVVRPMTNE